MASDSDLVRTARQHGYQVEYVRNFDGTEDSYDPAVSMKFDHVRSMSP